MPVVSLRVHRKLLIVVGLLVLLGPTAIQAKVTHETHSTETANQSTNVQHQDRSLDELDRQQDLNNLNQNIDALMRLTKQIAHRTQSACERAFGDASFCKCLAWHLPTSVSFQGYVAIVSHTKSEIKYGSLSKHKQELVNKVRAVRDRCVVVQ